jgi:hypothetical protein
MPNKQIVLTQYDTGIELDIQFLDNKTPVDITGCSVELEFINPEGTLLDTQYGQITNGVNGECAFVLTELFTDVDGLWKTYLQVVNDSSEITAQEEIYYYVRPKFGGES